MAKNKKPRTPTPPRSPQAPQRRVQAPQRRVDDVGMKHRAILYGIALAGLVGLVAVVLFIVLNGPGKTNDAAVAAAMTSAGCSFRTVPAYVPKGQTTHVNSLTANDHWNTNPPSNGQHYPEWDVWGFWTQVQNPRQVVHNEEHGGVILWWGSKVSKATVAQLHAFYSEKPGGMLGTPYPSLGSKFAVTAWTGNPIKYQRGGYYGFGHIAICSSYTPKTHAALKKFRDTYVGKGPEGIPLCDDQPGDTPTSSSC